MDERVNVSSGSPYESAVGYSRAATMVEVSALIDPGLRVEIEPDAYAPEG